MLNTSGKRRRSSRVASSKRRKGSAFGIPTTANDQENAEKTDLDNISGTPSTCRSLSRSTESPVSTTSLTSLNSEDDFLGLRNFLANSRESSTAKETTYVESPEALIPPTSGLRTRSASISSNPALTHTEDASHFLYVQDHSAIDNATGPPATNHKGHVSSPLEPSPDYGRSNHGILPKTSSTSAAPPLPVISSTMLPKYSFISQPNCLSDGSEPSSPDRVFMQMLSDDTADVHKRTGTSRLQPRNTLILQLPRLGTSLLNIKLRPITKSKFRALDSKEIPPLYVPILPSALAWCLVEDTDPDSEDELPITDPVALRTAQHLTGLKVLKRNVARSQKQEELKGRLVSHNTDDELLREYLTAVTKRKPTKKVTFDDTAARIVLADWKGISIDDL